MIWYVKRSLEILEISWDIKIYYIDNDRDKLREVLKFKNIYNFILGEVLKFVIYMMIGYVSI